MQKKKNKDSDFVIYYASPDYLSRAVVDYEAMYEPEMLRHQDKIDELAESMKEKGFLEDAPKIPGYHQPDEFKSSKPNVPVVHLDSLGYISIMDGNHRIRAAKQAGLKKIPFIFNNILCDTDELRKNSMFYASKKSYQKHLIKKYPELNLDKDEELFDIIHSPAYGICKEPTKVTTKDFIKENTYIDGNRWDGMYVDSRIKNEFREDSVPKDFLEKTTFQFL